MVASVTYDSASGTYVPSPPSDAVSNSEAVAGADYGFNGTNWERDTHNLEITALASAARTVTLSSSDLSNFNCRGVMLWVSVTAVTSTPSTVITVTGKDPVGGTYTTLLTSAALAATGVTQLAIYPGITAAANTAVSMVLPRTWRVTATHGNANSMTYSVSGCLIL